MLIVMLMVILVDSLLLFAAGRFCGDGGRILRILLAGVLDGLFAACSLLPGFSFLGHFMWRLCSLLLAGLVAFGFSRKMLPKLLLFCLFALSLGSVSREENEILGMLLGAAGIGLACLVVGKRSQLIPVQLTFRGQTLQLTALRDTGNTLRDPVTGKAVLVVDAKVAQKLTGLSTNALRDPVNSLLLLPGLRLIPYKTVGNSGFLLALSIPNAKIGNRQGSTLVALSPNLFAHHYQALTGGMV